jgi:hypothetical protein
MENLGSNNEADFERFCKIPATSDNLTALAWNENLHLEGVVL